MSKSIIIKKNGGPEVLEIQEVKVGSPGPDEIKVTNHAIGLNYIDTYHRSGLYPIKLPSGIGLEASGKIDEVGSNVTEFNKGDNIACIGSFRSLCSTKNYTCKDSSQNTKCYLS